LYTVTRGRSRRDVVRRTDLAIGTVISTWVRGVSKRICTLDGANANEYGKLRFGPLRPLRQR